jgi:VacB/RNase II family 3'-5' exoribonuclease
MRGDFDLADRARRALEAAGFQSDFPAKALSEARAAERSRLPEVRDLSHLLWSSIDNQESRDLDQLEYAEPGPEGSIRLLLAIADVASYVPRGSAMDQRASHNTVSLYTAGKTFHLLPAELSTGKTSLLQNETRLALVADMLVEDDGEVHAPNVYQAKVRNKARLTYDAVGGWLESAKPLAEFGETPGLKEQLTLQWQASQRLELLRKKMGALTFSSYEAHAVIRDGRCVDLAICERSRARDLIESFMVATNVATATFLKNRGFPIIERAVHAPKRWDRICQIAAGYGVRLPDTPAPKPLADFLAERRVANPDEFKHLSLAVVKLLGSGEYVVEPANQQLSGHFGLAVDDYSHSTAPNRRYSDLVIQRLLFATVGGNDVPYTDAELQQIAQRCTEREDAARKVERFMRKVAAADFMRDQVGREFGGIVTGASGKGTYVRLFRPAVEGKVVRGERGMDVGDRVQVRLIFADPERGFIDFERAD